VFSRKQLVRVLSPRLHVIADRIWGDGVLFADYWTNGLDIVEFVKDRDTWVAVLALPRVYHAGETFELRTERRIVGGFRRSAEDWGSVMYAPAKNLSLEVTGVARKRIRNPELFASIVEGASVDESRRSIRLSVRRPRVNSSYGLRWAW
jgi:hypothetical protein